MMPDTRMEWAGVGKSSMTDSVMWSREARMDPNDQHRDAFLTKTDLITIGIVAVIIIAMTALLLLLLF
jgi:hypothetical protein